MGAGGISPGDERAAVADDTSSVLAKEVVGNKSDAAVAVVGTTASLVAYAKGILNTLAGGVVDDVVFPLGPVGNVLVQPDDSAVRYAIYLVNFGGNVLTDGETVPGTFVVHRVRAGVDSEIISSTASTESNGIISAVVDFSAGGNWADGDLGYIEFTGITATVGASTSELPVIRKSFRVSQEVGIETKIDTIDGLHDVPAADVVTNAQMRDVAGNKVDAAAVGGVSATESLVAYVKELVLGVGLDGATSYVGGFNEVDLAGRHAGAHSTVGILFVIPEAVGAITADNTAILTILDRLGHVDTITQSDALTYPHFAEYNIVVLGSDSGTVWTVSNLNHVKEFPEPVICVDARAAAQLLIGSDGGDAATKTALVAVSQINANDLGIGLTGLTGLVAGSNVISSSASYSTLDMSDANITETFFGTEAVADNTDVLLAALFKRQPDGTRGILSDVTEATGTRYFYGPAFSAGSLNTLGLDVLEILGNIAIQATTAALDFEISGDIGDLETKIFGNMANEFNNGNPLVEYMAGRNTTGTRLAIGKSMYDVIGAAYVDAGGGLGTDSVLADLGLIHGLVDSAETTGPFSYLDAGGEQDVVEDTAVTRRRITVNFDLTAMTLNGTVRLLMKVDASGYVIYDETVFVAAGAEQAFDYQFTTNQNWKLTYQESADEGAARAIPFNVITEVIE